MGVFPSVLESQEICKERTWHRVKSQIVRHVCFVVIEEKKKKKEKCDRIDRWDRTI